MRGEDEKNRGGAPSAPEVEHQHYPPPPQPLYGTFQGVANHPPPTYPPPTYPQHQHQHHPPVTGFPQPAPPPGAHDHFAHGYQAVQGYAVAEGRPVREHRLPCCGIGVGWFLFIIGFFLGAIPWYVGLFVLLCARMDPREKPGYVACTIAAVLATIAIVLGVTKGVEAW